MARKKTTVYVEEDLLKAAKIMAVRSGKREYEIFEDALREHLGLTAVENVWRRSDLDDTAALELAYEELHASRKE
jgi:hypothetical protein